jgi:hypothetical protein
MPTAAPLMASAPTINRQAGIYDSSLLGNAYHRVPHGQQRHPDGQRWCVTVAATCVSYGGKLYQVVVGQDAGASTNAPSGTTADNQWWWYRQAGAPGPGGPLWVSGIHVRAGGAQCAGGAVVLGGALADWMRQGKNGTDGVAVIGGGANGGGVLAAPVLKVQSGQVVSQLGAAGNVAATSDYVLNYWYHPGTLANSASVRILGTDEIYFEVGGAHAFRALGPGNTDAMGRAAAPVSGIRFPNPVYLGDAMARHLSMGTAAPGSGARTEGDFYHDASTTSGKLGYKCLASGTPGTWETHYALTAAKSTGWAAATGTATRTTYDTATVTTAQLAERVKALIDDLTTRGVIGA